MWNDDTNKRALSSSFLLFSHEAAFHLAPTIPRRLCWVCLAFFNTRFYPREERTRQSYGLLLRTIEFTTKKKAALGVADAPGSARKSSTDAKFWQLHNKGRCLPAMCGEMYRGMYVCVCVCLSLFIRYIFRPDENIFISNKNLLHVYFMRMYDSQIRIL